LNENGPSPFTALASSAYHDIGWLTTFLVSHCHEREPAISSSVDVCAEKREQRAPVFEEVFVCGYIITAL
jgi:hypothetical protein